VNLLQSEKRVSLTLAPLVGLAIAGDSRDAFRNVLGVQLANNRSNVKHPSRWLGNGDGEQQQQTGISLFNFGRQPATFLGDEIDETVTLQSLEQGDVTFFVGRVEHVHTHEVLVTREDCKGRTSARDALNKSFEDLCSVMPSGVKIKAISDADRTLKIEASGLADKGVMFRLKMNARSMRLLRLPESTIELSQSSSATQTGKWGKELSPFQALPTELSPFKIVCLTHKSVNNSFVNGHGFVNLACELGERGEVKNSEKLHLNGDQHLLQLVVVDNQLRVLTFHEPFKAVVKLRFNSQFSAP